MRRTGLALAALSVAVLLAGCNGTRSGPDKAGQRAASAITLRLGTGDSEGHPDTALLERFASEVAKLSDGRLRIKLIYRAVADAPAFERAIVQRVRDGGLDLGWIGARAWDTEGVLTFQGLQAPFLITDYPLLDRVLTDPIAAQLLAGLHHVGMVGLGLFPGQLRHPVGFGRPLRTLRDFRGAHIRVPASSASDALMRALGAVPVHLDGGPLVSAIQDHVIRGADTSVGNAPFLAGRLVLTDNITFYPETFTLFTTTQRYAELPQADQQLLRSAAQRTLDFATRQDPEPRGASAICARGGDIVQASARDVAAIRRAAQTVYGPMERDPGTRALIGLIRALRATMPPAATRFARCAPGATG